MRARMRRAEEPTVDVNFSLVFPREALSVPVMRRVLGDTLRRLGADEDGIADLLLAVTEACTNVIRHGRGGPERRYEVMASLGEGGCLVQVWNGPRRFDSRVMPRTRRPSWRSVRYPSTRHRWAVRPGMRKLTGQRLPLENQEIATLPESGRGLAIMRACVDDVTLRGAPGRGTVVSLQKRMELHTDVMLASPAGVMLASPAGGQLRDVG
jgi:serine/threonine-protein kinase RsbW